MSDNCITPEMPSYIELMNERDDLKSENTRLKIDYAALENCNKKLAHANERIIAMQDQREPLLEQNKKLKAQLQTAIRALKQSCYCFADPADLSIACVACKALTDMGYGESSDE